ncbi:hypothetical protein YC2023_021440 [Brassica napus]
MPSRFNPCSLNQLYALRYRTISVVHATRGLRDAIENFNYYSEVGAGAGQRSWSWCWTELPTFVKSMRPNRQQAAEVSLVRYCGQKYLETKSPITKKQH